ncbi:hypothetical protein, partial [Ferrimicrobium sp.]|uniref:hypothetical protein n=1 Tax=Ferrimicrobium sp. TaxID=2926050 RepID=UPI0026266CCC
MANTYSTGEFAKRIGRMETVPPGARVGIAPSCKPGDSDSRGDVRAQVEQWRSWHLPGDGIAVWRRGLWIQWCSGALRFLVLKVRVCSRTAGSTLDHSP